MNREEFMKWLDDKYPEKDLGTKKTIVGKCQNIENFEGNLDDEYAVDGLARILSLYTYSKKLSKNGVAPLHHMPINGDLYNGTASYKSCLKNYIDYKNDSRGLVKCKPKEEKEKPLSKKKPTVSKSVNREWPVWETGSNDTIFRMAQEITPYIRFLSPQIVEKITEANEKNRNDIIDTLKSNNINPDLYMWEGSPCAFPGIRRSVGSSEKKGIWKGETGFSESKNSLNTAISLDDNDMPKQIWSFIFTGKSFNKVGPYGYSLAHLIDHKFSRNRMADYEEKVNGKSINRSGEFEFTSKCVLPSPPIYGLFSSPANSVYITNALMKPTDYNSDLRKLLFAKAIELYRGVCSVIPKGIKLQPPDDKRFDINAFKWAEPVGDPKTIEDWDDRIEAFFKCRKELYLKHGYGMYN